MFRVLFLTVGIAAVALSLLLLLAPQTYLSLYVDVTEGSTFAARRLAPAVFGLGALLVLASSLPKGAFAARFATLGALVWFAIAATGIYDFTTGTANANILVAAASEALLGVLFLIAARSHRAP
jgi:hypothetical protein